MRENGVFIAHCPTSNINLTSGTAPVRKYLDLDMKIGLGIDVAGRQTESIFRAITYAIGVSKMYLRYVDENAKAVTFEEAFYMATKLFRRYSDENQKIFKLSYHNCALLVIVCGICV